MDDILLDPALNFETKQRSLMALQAYVGLHMDLMEPRL